jgi:curved DNA-binding protein CbpA
MLQQEKSESLDFYQVLGVAKTATDEEIKKAYRRNALKYHPDKAGNSQEAADKFEMVQKANETLSDPKLKKLYDKYGHDGLAMMKQLGEFAPFVDPEALLEINWLLSVVSFLIALLIVFHSLLAAKIDSNISWPYMIVFLPVFIVNLILLFTIIAFKNKDNDEERPKMNEMLLKFGIVTYILSFTIFLILVSTNLDSYTNLSWGVVSVFWFYPEALNVVLSLGRANAESKKPVYEASEDLESSAQPKSLTMTAIAMLYFQNLFPVALRIVQAILILKKISSTSFNYSWAVVFLPTWIGAAVEFFQIIFGIYVTKKSAADKPESYNAAIVKLIIFTIWGALFYTGMGLLTARLNSGFNPSIGVVMIPLFIALSVLFCCFCCCIPLSVKATTQAFENELKGMNPSPNARDAQTNLESQDTYFF